MEIKVALHVPHDPVVYFARPMQAQYFVPSGVDRLDYGIEVLDLLRLACRKSAPQRRLRTSDRGVPRTSDECLRFLG
jgi:hypothetical protein